MAPIHLRTGLAALWLALLPGAGCEPEAEEDDAADDDATGDDDDPGAPFTLIAVPDIQYVTLAYPEVLLETTGWIAEEADDRDILFTLQEGDLTHENSELEWDNASAGFDVLEDEPAQPYALCLGNHDGVSAGDTSLFHQYFPVSRFDHRPWFGGTMDPDQMDNAWFGFDAGPTGWLVLSLTYDPNSEVIAWASSVVEEHSDRRVIVLTHAYLAPSGELSGAGERIWDELVRLHPSMTLVLNGHYTGGEAARLLSRATTATPWSSCSPTTRTGPSAVRA